MESSNYLRRLAWEARWRLPKEEAEEIIADYTELLEGDSRSAKELFRDLGTPRQAVRLLDEKDDAYHRWLATLAVLTLYIGVPWVCLFTQNHHANYAIFLLLLGAASSIRWFRRTGQENPPEKTPLPRGLRPLLALQAAAVCVGIAGWSGIIAVLNGAGWILPSQMGVLSAWIFRLAGTAAAGIGLFGVIRARMSDRRWITLYTFGMMTVVLCVQFLAHTSSMNLDESLFAWHMLLLKRSVLTLAAGLIASGVAIC